MSCSPGGGGAILRTYRALRVERRWLRKRLSAFCVVRAREGDALTHSGVLAARSGREGECAPRSDASPLTRIALSLWEAFRQRGSTVGIDTIRKSLRGPHGECTNLIHEGLHDLGYKRFDIIQGHMLVAAGYASEP